MKKLLIFIFCFFIIILYFNYNLFGLKSNFIINKDTIKKLNPSIDIGIVSSPLIHTFSFLSIPSGLTIFYRFDKKSILGISAEFLYDPVNYHIIYYYENNLPPNNVKYIYHYIYYPILLNFNFKNSYLSTGIINRVVIPYKYKDYGSNPSWGIQIGYGRNFKLNKEKLKLYIDPYIIIMGSQYQSSTINYQVVDTNSSILLIGINLQITYNLK